MSAFQSKAHGQLTNRLVCPRFKDLAMSLALSLWPAGGQAANGS